MIRDFDRKLVRALVRLKIWRLSPPEDRARLNFRCWRIVPHPWTRWLWNWMVKRQSRDGLHHAPCCPGNEWSGVELVFQRCNCGAAHYAKHSGDGR